ncbi:MAG TPA: MFS transporter [Propionibacteriaceae bacterium]|nr:MFS transporter [Propionibacteriaceae bacterium]
MSTAGDPVSRRALTIGLCTAVVGIAFEAIAVATAMPAAARDLHGLNLYAWAFSLFSIGMLFATVASGRLADTIGPARPMLGGLTIFAIGLAVSATAQDMYQLIAGRLVQGLGSGTMAVAIYVCIAQVFEPWQRPRMFSYISTAWVLPSFVGPPVAAFLTHRFGWPWVFWAVLPLLAIAAVMVVPSLLAMIRTPPTSVSQPAARKPAALWAAGLAAGGAALIQLAGQRLDGVGAVCAVAGLSLLAVSLPNLMPRRFFHFSRGLPSVIVVRGLIAGSFFGAEAFVPLMLVEQRGLPLLLAGGVLTLGALGWTSGSWLQSRPALALRRDRIITLGAACLVIGLALAAVTAHQPDLWVGLVGVAWVIGGLGMGLSMASTSLAVMTVSTVAEQGRNASSLQLGEALGASIFVGLAGSIFHTLQTQGRSPAAFSAAIAAMTLVALASFGVSMRIGRIDNELAAR